MKGLSVKDVRRGDVAGDAKRDPPAEAESFVAQVVVSVKKRFLYTRKSMFKKQKLKFACTHTRTRTHTHTSASFVYP